MKLLFLTQVVDADDAVLGFVPRWLQGLARHCERVRAITLRQGNLSTLPANVDVRVVGERGKLWRWWRYQRYLREALAVDGFDAVLAHMVPRYALLAEGPARRHGAGLYLWYTHAGVDERLRRAVTRVDKVFTASPESLRVETERRVVTGHGIDLEHFPLRDPAQVPALSILSVGRLTPAKDPLVVLEALALLRARGLSARLEWVGGTMTQADQGFEAQVRQRALQLQLSDGVRWLGAKPYREIPAYYRSASVLVNASHTGSVDKVVLEAMASGTPVLSCNDSIPPVLASLGAQREALLFPAHDATALADRLQALWQLPAAQLVDLGQRLRGIVARDHEVDALMLRLVQHMERR